MADLYHELAPAERNAMVAEFYSREFSVLGGAQSAAGQLGSLVAAWEGMDGPKRRAIMKHMILALSPIIEKAYVDPAPIHRCAVAAFGFLPHPSHSAAEVRVHTRTPRDAGC